jgi:hypothetical protein
MRLLKFGALLLFVTLLLVSCKSYRLAKQIKSLMGQEIVMPQDMRLTPSEADDSLMIDIQGKSAHLIVYVDSVECSSCKVGNLPQYSDIVNFCEQLNGKCEPVFIFSPREQDVEKLRYRIDISEIDYNIVIDSTRSFPKANPHIPADNRLHTFLLDKNGKVVLVGDPSHNPELWELYKKTITQLIENGGTLGQ